MIWRPRPGTDAERRERLVYLFVARRPRCTLREVCQATGLRKRNAQLAIERLVGARRLVELTDDAPEPSRYVAVKGDWYHLTES